MILLNRGRVLHGRMAGLYDSVNDEHRGQEKYWSTYRRKVAFPTIEFSKSHKNTKINANHLVPPGALGARKV